MAELRREVKDLVENGRELAVSASGVPQPLKPSPGVTIDVRG